MCTHMKRVQIGARYVKQTNQTKQKSKLGFLGKCLYMQTEAYVSNSNNQTCFEHKKNYKTNLNKHA